MAELGELRQHFLVWLPLVSLALKGLLLSGVLHLVAIKSLLSIVIYVITGVHVVVSSLHQLGDDLSLMADRHTRGISGLLHEGCDTYEERGQVLPVKLSGVLVSNTVI